MTIVKEIATGGACCMRKLSEQSFGLQCEWLSTGEKVTDIEDPKTCQIITVTFDGTDLQMKA